MNYVSLFATKAIMSVIPSLICQVGPLGVVGTKTVSTLTPPSPPLYSVTDIVTG